jgi:hypothetical protein
MEAQQQLEVHQLKMEEINIIRDMLEKETDLHRQLCTACREEEEYWKKQS